MAPLITAADIAVMGATAPDQVLETVAGMHLNRNPNNYSPRCAVRGIISPHTPQLLVLQNGVPVTTLYAGHTGRLWGGYPLEHIARRWPTRPPST